MNYGLCSVTFRNLSPTQIIALCKQNGVTCIEWGGDIHVPTGDIATAQAVGALTRERGLTTPSYGSYFRCEATQDFQAVSATAQALGAKIIRIWAGKRDAEAFSQKEYQNLVQTVKTCADIAQARGQILAFEHHFGTYCNNAKNTLRLLRDINRENVKTYWQPAYWVGDDTFAIDMQAIGQLKARIVGVHVYAWQGFQRLPLAAAKQNWLAYKKLIGDNNYFLEFVKDDDTANFAPDCKTLKQIVTK